MQLTPPAENLTKLGPFNVAVFRRHGLWALPFAAVGGLLAFLLSFGIAPVYVGQAVLLPVTGSSGTGGLLQLPSAFGELTSMAGFSAAGGDDATEALETLQSRALAERFIKEHELVDTLVEPSLIARIIGQSTRISPTKDLNLAIARFRDSIVNVVEDKRTGVVHLSVFWKDPKLAADWANGLVSLVNQELRSKAIDESKRRLAYLNAEVERTSVVGVKEAVYRVIEAEIKAMMLANARSEFAFRVIDAAAPAELDDFIRPNRMAFLVSGFFFVGLATIFFLQRRRGAA